MQSGWKEVRRAHGEWTYDFLLPGGLWTRGVEGIPHTRLRRIAQVVHDLGSKPLSQSRILDLGCLEGLFSLEFASQGAEVVAVEVRDANIEKARFCAQSLGLEDRVTFLQEDVRNVTAEQVGSVDAVICSGLLYHLPAADSIALLRRMRDWTSRLVVVDTVISLDAVDSVEVGDRSYWGRFRREHGPGDAQERKAARLLSSWENEVSFRFTRPSLVNALSHAGFSSAYECFEPTHLNFGKPGFEPDRCTLVAVKGEARGLELSPSV